MQQRMTQPRQRKRKHAPAHCRRHTTRCCSASPPTPDRTPGRGPNAPAITTSDEEDRGKKAGREEDEVLFPTYEEAEQVRAAFLAAGHLEGDASVSDFIVRATARSEAPAAQTQPEQKMGPGPGGFTAPRTTHTGRTSAPP